MGSLRSLASYARADEREIARERETLWKRISLIIHHVYKVKGRKIEAIKFLREVSYVKLKEAKDAVEQESWEQILRSHRPSDLLENLVYHNIDLNKLEIEYGIRTSED